MSHYMLVELLDELFLYSDDFLFLAETQRQVEAIGFSIFIMSIMGVPFRWGKFKGGTNLVWIGYWPDVRSFRIGVSKESAAWLSGWLRARAHEGKVDIQDLEAALGRLCLAVGPLEFL